MRNWINRLIGNTPSSPEQSDQPADSEDLRRNYRQEALRILSQDDGLMPSYRKDIADAAAYQETIDNMPLVVIWNEQRTADGISYSISVNPLIVRWAFVQLMSENDPWLAEECVRLLDELKRMTEASLNRTIQLTGSMPSEICAQL